MSALRRIRLAATLLVVLMALFVSTEMAIVNVKAAPSAVPAPTHARPGTLITVTLTAFSASDTTCTISGTPVGSNPPAVCSLTGGTGTVTFTVAQYAAVGTFTITVVGSPTGGSSDTAQFAFTVDGFTLVLRNNAGSTTNTGSPGTEIRFTMTNVPLYDTSCSVSGFQPGGQPSGVVTSSGCVVSGTGGGGVSGTGNGTFIIGNVPPGNYIIEITACTGNNGCAPSAGDFAQQELTVTGGPTITLNPTSGPIGTDVVVTGSGFLPTDQSCSISSISGPIITNAGCAITSGTNATHGSFLVGNVPPGQYVIEVTGCPGNNGCAPSAGDFAQAVFTVTSGPTLKLLPPQGPTGTHVQINGTGFLPSDTTCTITSPSSGSIIVNAACAIVPPNPPGGKPTNKTTGSFYVGNVQIGQYVIRVTGNGGDFAEAIFNVTRGPQLILIPSKGPTGTHVSIEGGFFLTSDTTCTISSPSAGNVIQGAGCSITAGSGLGAGLGNNVTGSFIVGNVFEGQYVIQVSGNQGDFAQAVFNVTRGAVINLIPAKGPTGSHVSFEGTFFLSTDTTCTVSSPSGGTIIQGAGCSVFTVSSGPLTGFTNVTGSFVVGNVFEGQYVIQVSGNQGDFAQGIFNVTRGAFIQVSGINGAFSPLGQAANVTFKASSGPFLGFMNVSGSFIVGNVPEGQYIIQVSGNQGDFAQGIFNVTRGAHSSYPRIPHVPFQAHHLEALYW
ncbi:MAG: hypothetical protein ABSF09_05735 [Candidatus Bathyarchaeia archaeon]